MIKIIALIPARSGSKRCPGKNTRMFFGHPLIAYTIRAAQQSGVFEKILVSSDSPETIEIAESYGCDAILRPDSISRDTSTDLEWVNHAIWEDRWLKNYPPMHDYFAILRPTSPFRSAELIRDAWDKYLSGDYDSLRAIEMRDHPWKMWEYASSSRDLIYDFDDENIARLSFRDLCDQPTQSLHSQRPVYTQNGCLQIAKTSLLPHTITGMRVYGYDMTGNLEGFDINKELDWILAEELVKRGMVKLPGLSLKDTNPHITEESLRQSVLSSSRIEGTKP